MKNAPAEHSSAVLVVQVVIATVPHLEASLITSVPGREGTVTHRWPVGPMGITASQQEDVVAKLAAAIIGSIVFRLGGVQEELL